MSGLTEVLPVTSSHRSEVKYTDRDVGVVCIYFHAYIHPRFKHAVLGTHTSAIGAVSPR